MPLDTAALHMAEPTKPLPPKTTIYKDTHLSKCFCNKKSSKKILDNIKLSKQREVCTVHTRSLLTSATTSIVEEL